jgi:outer membrane protein assembly factor BamB
LRKLFGSLLNDDGNRGGTAGSKAEGESRASRRGPRDAVDARIPHDSTQGKHLEQAEQLIEQGQWDPALERLEILLAGSANHATIRTPDGHPRLVAWEANRLLGRLPASVLDTYRLKHEAQARQLYLDAQQMANWDHVIDVATQFFHTETGQQAANAVGNFHFDRGEFGLAALWYVRLLNIRAPVANDRKWCLKVALTLREAGNTAASDQLLRELPLGGPEGEIDLGGDSVQPNAWLRKLGEITPNSAPVLDEWLQFLGTPRRTGLASGGDPLLLSRWFHPTTQNKLVVDQLELLSQDLIDAGRAAIPTAFPLMVQDRIAFRTLRGVHVVDASTGRLLWETRPEIAEESLVNGTHSALDFEDRFAWAANANPFRRFRGRFSTDFVGGDGADGHALTGLLNRNANFGLLASDGVRLFVIEDDAIVAHGPVGSGFQLVGEPLEGHRRTTPGNRLTAYALATGREAWTIGGPLNGESFDLPLAGHFFFGVPLVDGGDLFVVTEHDLDIRLYALDPATGRVRWSQLLAHSDNKIEQDLGRRWWTAQVACSNGILVCPTTVNWLVGVDRLDHSVLWMHRYAPPRPGVERRERDQGESFVAPNPLNKDWCPSAPVIAGNRVIYTPAEEPVLVCLDLANGRLRWKFLKGEDQLYLAGVDDGRVIVVGKSSVTALGLSNGHIQWTASIEEGQGPPSGRGLILPGKFYLPLKSGSLCTIDLATGKPLETTQLLPGSKPLGNLATYRGLTLSLNDFGLTAFEQRDAIQRQIAVRQAANPRDEWASVKEAEIALLQNDPTLALASLDHIDSTRVEPKLSTPYRSALIDALTSAVRRNYGAATAELQQLSSIVRTGSERLLLGRLEAEQAKAAGHYGKAFEVLRQLAIADRSGLTIARPDDSRVTIEFDAWIAGELEEIWPKLSQKDQARFDLLLRDEAARVLRMDRSARERFVSLYRFHPAARGVIAALVNQYVAENDLFGAERLLTRQIRRGAPDVAAAAQLRLAQVLSAFRLDDDADAAHRELAARYGKVPLARGVTAERYVEDLSDAGLLSAAPHPAAAWSGVDLKVYRFGANSQSPNIEELLLGATERPFFKEHRFIVDERRQRLEIVRAEDDAQHWLVPLRRANRTRQGEYSVGFPAGHGLAVLHRDVLHFLSPADRRLLWTRTLEVPNGGGEYRSLYPHALQPLRTGSQFVTRNSLLSRVTDRGMVAVVNSEYVCIYGRREFLVLDAHTGDLRWKCSGLPLRAKVFGNDETLFMIPPDRSESLAFRAQDGKRLNVPKLGDLLVNAVALTPRGIVGVGAFLTGALGVLPSATVIHAQDPVSGKTEWTIAYPGGTRLGLLDDSRMLAVSQSGDVECVNLLSGDVQKFQGKYSEAEVRSFGDVVAVPDRDCIYLVANGRQGRRSRYAGGFRSQQPVDGRVAAYDCRTGSLLWQQTVGQQNLVLDFLRDSPVLTFATRETVHSRDFRHWNFNLLVLDKHTGKTLLSTTEQTTEFNKIEINMAERYLELRSYSQRLRLLAVDRQKRAPATSERAEAH